MKLLIAALTLISSPAFADNSAKLLACVQNYALKHVDEHNLPNEALMSTSPEAKKSALMVLRKMDLRAESAENAELALRDAEATGLVIQYGDEVQLIYVGVSLQNGKCRVHFAGDLNTVDISGGVVQLTPTEVSKFFLNKSRTDLIQELGAETVSVQIYDDIIESLKQ